MIPNLHDPQADVGECFRVESFQVLPLQGRSRMARETGVYQRVLRIQLVTQHQSVPFGIVFYFHT